MDAAKLVDLRKNGEITQEQFFLALNKLRRANSGLDKPPPSSSTTTAAAVSTAPGSIPAGGSPAPGTPPQQDAFGSGCIDVELAPQSGSEDDSVRSTPDSCRGSIGPPAAKPTWSQTSQPAATERRPASPGEHFADKDDAHPAGRVPPQQPEGWDCEARLISESGSGLIVNPGSEADHSESKASEKIDHFVGGVGACAAASGDQTNVNLVPSRGSREVEEGGGGRSEESEWLFTPSGEKSQSVRRHVREPPEPRHDSPTHIVNGGGDGGTSSSTINRSTAGLSPGKSGCGGVGDESGTRADDLGSENRRSWPVEREPQPHRQGNRRRSRSQPPTRSLSRRTDGDHAAELESVLGEKNGRGEKHIGDRSPDEFGRDQQPRSAAARDQRSPAISRSNRKGEQRGLGGVASPGSGAPLLRRSTHSADFSSPAVSETAAVASDAFLRARRRDPATSRDGNNVGSELPAALRRGRSLSQERNAPARGSRRLSVTGNSSARSSRDPDRYNTGATYDQYGYPLHENACLASSEAGVGTNGLVFTPTIKRLPEFYDSRPKLTPDSAKQHLGWTREAGWGQSSSMYERGTGWQANIYETRCASLCIGSALLFLALLECIQHKSVLEETQVILGLGASWR